MLVTSGECHEGKAGILVLFAGKTVIHACAPVVRQEDCVDESTMQRGLISSGTWTGMTN